MGKSKRLKAEADNTMQVDIQEGDGATAQSEAKVKKSKKRVLEASTVVNDEGGTEEPPKKKKKKSKKEKETMEVDDDDTINPKFDESSNVADTSSKKERKAQKNDWKNKKSGTVDDSMDVDAQSPGDADPGVASVDVEKSKDKKKKKDKSRSKKEDAFDEPSPPVEESIPLVFDAEPSALPSPKKKREKRPKDRIKNKPVKDSSPSEATTKQKKKRARKNRTSFPDPEADESLNLQAQKALDYAFTQFNAPNEWKFNKARQNWIIRNAFSAESIPETYLSLAIKYLSGLQGGSRDKLKDTCNSIITAPPPPPPKSTNPDGPKSILKKPTEEGPFPAKVKSSAKAGPLIDMPKAGPLIDTPKTGALVEPEAIEQVGPSPADVKLERAKALLEALEASGES
ncbi:hypothetical protein BKA70DRAFT_576163 [Coprinopsis sp. MPI-PUGE-AT-0042]|nr:hypothetical protein BKA70DRAFT_576163 [Coprinopsis sp. MPI-PUGE-AT-0042]